MDDHLIRLLEAGSLEDLRSSLDGLGDEDLERVAVGLQTLVRRATATFAITVGELDRRAVPDRTYALSTKQWLRRFCRQSGSEAAATVGVARGIAHMPHVAKRSLEGEIPLSGLRRLAAARTRHPEEFALCEETLAEAAANLDGDDLRRALEYWRQQVDHADAVDEVGDRRAQRTASIARTIDGMWHLDAWLDPESGATVATALRGQADPGNVDPGDDRSHGQRMADALTEISRRSLDHPDGDVRSGGERPHLTVTVGYDQLTDADGSETALPEIESVAVDHETIRRLGCDARIVRIVLDGASQPLDVGRAVRTVTPAIRRALEVRDGGCTWLGCDLPSAWCDAHHIEHWADGGVTSLANLRLLCRRHHVVVHEGGDPATGRRAPPRT